ncbi:MAG: HEAT repeat domain-containing protein, partial [Candidatus Aminicenantes bacterium]|nr:HEAT repeat domain-containing protein [Candidatus Aminicenantes bacterium]
MKPKKIKLFIPGLILFSIVIPANPDINSLTGDADRFMMTRILKAEDNRDEKQLLELAKIGKKNKKNIIISICHASGRIPSFKTWEALSGKHFRWQCITDALAIAARYPENKFPKDRVFKILINFPLSETVVETMLFLNTKEAFEFVLPLKRFRKTVARNLWRSKDYLTREILKTFYQQVPEATIYSIYRSRTKGLVQSGDIRNMNLHNQYYGCLVCDQPKEFLKDPAWQVRIAAVKAADSVESSKELLTDTHPLVRAAAMEVYLKKNGNPSVIQVDQLNVMEADILAPRLRHRILIKRIFDRNGLFSEVAAPYLDRSEKNMILSSTLSDKARVMFVENQMGKKNAISYAITLFQNQNSSFALQYLLFQKEGVQKDKIIETAKAKGCFHSELQDFGYIKPKPVKRPLIFYAAL